MQLIKYILFSSVCLSILYLAYRLIYRNEANFRQMRIFLMGSVLLSLLLPLSNYKIEIWNKPQNAVIIPQFINPTHAAGTVPENNSLPIDWSGIALDVYLLVSAVLFIRIILQLIILSINYIKSQKLKRNDCVLLFDHRFRNTFSFFDWIFIGPEKIKKEDLEHIIIHERIHATQYHTLDLIVIELLTAVMWFNPLIWMMKNSIQLVHEYLADEGALNTGIDQHRYQALLINQITEDKLISLSSSFNHSLIKKRMKMMINKKLNRRSNLKIMALLPLAALLFMVIALINALMPRDLTAAPAKPLNVFGFNHGSDQLNTPVTPADTVKTKTIKIVHKQAGPDSIITETYDVKVIGDTARGTKIIYYNDKKMTGDTTRVVYVISKDHPEIMLSEDPDSLEDIMVNTNVMHKNKVIIKETIMTSDNSTSEELSNTLVIIDGIEHPEQDALSSISPDKIESVDVIKDKKMIKKYTDKDYDGVIIVKTKTGKK
jgi:hypothetical protein